MVAYKLLVWEDLSLSPIKVKYSHMHTEYFGKVRKDVKANPAAHIAMSCINETNHKNILAFYYLYNNMLIHKTNTKT